VIRALVRRLPPVWLMIACVLGPLAHATAFAAAPAGHYQVSAETAFDVRTRLEWVRQSGPRVMLDGALQACSGHPGGQWRVPSARELETLVDVRASTAPAWDHAAFGGAPEGPPVFWTLTRLPVAAPPATHIVVDFRPAREVMAQGEDDLALVRCVRGPR
jgi:hypothetical protein